MSKVTVEFYNGTTRVFDNARYSSRGENFYISRNGKVCVRVGRVYVYAITLTAGGRVPTANNAGVGTAQSEGNAKEA